MSRIHVSSVSHRRENNFNRRSGIKVDRVGSHHSTAKSEGTNAESKKALLPFNSKGRLRRGIHTITWEVFTKRFGYNLERQKLLRGLLRGIRLLQLVGCRTIYIGGSFVTTKQFPSDIDVVWESVGMSFERVERVAPIFLEITPGSPEQKHRFSSEFYPSEGIETISGLCFLEFFQRDWQKGRRRGLVRLDISRI